tara:strand:+ start:707 stop:979 length:273 start_codon:yes stop_codon:yes gene_type:complete
MARNKNKKTKSHKSDDKKVTEGKIEIQGTVTAALGGDKFMVKLEGSNQEVMAYMAGKMRKFYIRIVPGDKVTVELSPYDLTKGRITYRER